MHTARHSPARPACSPIRLGQLHSLAPAQVLLVHPRRQAPELDELVLLQPRGQPYLVKVVVRGDAGAKPLVVLLLDQQLVDRLVDLQGRWRSQVAGQQGEPTGVALQGFGGGTLGARAASAAWHAHAAVATP